MKYWYFAAIAMYPCFAMDDITIRYYNYQIIYNPKIK